MLFRSKVFELFSQEDRTLSRSQGGLGIGLTVVRSMVELHGGTVEVHSAGLGQGSEFTVVLPQMDYHIEPTAQEPAGQAHFVAARILIVDDNVDAAAMLSTLLQMEGYDVEVAHDGPSALTAFVRQKSEIVLCDIGLPGMDGYEVAKHLRQVDVDERPHPLLVALTGYDSAGDRERAFSAGFDDHLPKPVEFEHLLKLITQPRS